MSLSDIDLTNEEIQALNHLCDCENGCEVEVFKGLATNLGINDPDSLIDRLKSFKLIRSDDPKPPTRPREVFKALPSAFIATGRM